MCDNENIQYQMRTTTLNDDDYLKKLRDMVNISALSPEQRNVLEAYNIYSELLDNLLEKKWIIERNKITASVKQLHIESLQHLINAVHYERECFKQKQSLLIKELLVISRFLHEEEERKRLEEWRKSRRSSFMKR